MRLEKFCLRGFAQHEALDLTFRHGEPNLIIGPNEAGKSNLMTAITGTLFGIPNPERYTPWNGEPHMLARLSFVSGDRRVDIERRFLEQQVVVWVDGEQIYAGRGLVERNTAEDERYRSLLHQWIGFSEHDVFLRTVFVGQDRVQDRSLGDFTAQIKRLISGTVEANYETAIQDLEKELDTLIKLPRMRANRRRENLQDQLRDLNTRLQEAESVQEQVVSLIEEERDLEAALAEAKETQQRYRTLVENHGQLQEAIAEENQKRFAWGELEQQIERITGTRDRRAALEQEREQRQIPEDPAPGEIGDLSRDIERVQMRIESLSEAVDRNQSLRKQREFLESELEKHRIPGNVEPSDVREIGYLTEQAEREVNERQRELDRAIQRAPEARPASGNKGLSKALMLAAGGVLLLSLGLGLIVDPVLLAGVLLAAGLAGIALLVGRAPAPPPPAEITNPEIERLRQELAETQRTHSRYQERRDALLAESGVATLDDLFRRAREFQGNEMRLQALPEIDEQPEEDIRKAQQELTKLEQRRDELLQASGEADLEALEERAARVREIDRLLEHLEPVDTDQLNEMQERLQTIQQDAVMARETRRKLLEEHPELREVTAEQIGEYRQAVERAARQEDHAERRLYEVQLERQHLRRDTEDAGELRLQIQDVREQLEQVELSAEAHVLAIETLRASVQEFQENALEPVAERAGEYLSGITEGRYSGVTLERDSMTPFVDGNGQSSLAIDQLSRGARDQLYLSIRAALVDALSGDRNLPMLLDDPCVNFDDERLEMAARLIADLARERQMFLFTKDETWLRWFHPVVRLER